MNSEMEKSYLSWYLKLTELTVLMPAKHHYVDISYDKKNGLVR